MQRDEQAEEDEARFNMSEHCRILAMRLAAVGFGFQ